jgi:CrcB protein
MFRLFLVALGGSLGSVTRYWLAGVVQRAVDADLPFGTLAVNLAGSFLIGLVMALSLDRGALGTDARVFLTVGFCGGFTTMSTFGYETLALLREGDVAMAMLNAVASVVLCVIAVWLGDVLGRLT